MHDDGAETEARDGLERRSGGQRRYRNSLIFLAADTKGLDECRRFVKRSLAWQGIAKDNALDLTASQRVDARSQEESAAKTAREAIRKAWFHLLVPEPDATNPAKVSFQETGRRPSGQKSSAAYAWDTAKSEGCISEKMGARTLSEKIASLWPEDDSTLFVDTVRDWYFEHLHMERVRDETAIAEAISDAAAAMTDPPFALATGRDDDRFVGLALSKNVHVTFGTGMFVVKVDAATAQLDQPAVDAGSAQTGDVSPSDGGTSASGASDPKPHVPTGFSGVVSLDVTKGALTAAQVFENIICELERATGATVKITMEIHAEARDGFSSDVVEVVTDNAKTLGFDQKSFQ